MIVPTIALILTTGLGGVFLASAIPKLRRPKSFVLVVIEYQVLPERLAGMVGRVLPSVELGLACLMLVGMVPMIESAVAAMLLMGFIAGIGVNLARGRLIACGCFGHHRTIGWSLLLQDAALLGTSALATVLSRHEGMVASWSAIRVFDTSSLLPVFSSVACTSAFGMIALQALAQRRPAVPDAQVAANAHPPQVHPISERTSRRS